MHQCCQGLELVLGSWVLVASKAEAKEKESISKAERSTEAKQKQSRKKHRSKAEAHEQGRSPGARQTPRSKAEAKHKQRRKKA